MLIDKLCSELIKYLPNNLKIVDSCVGIKYTCTVVSDGVRRSIGVAYTPLEDIVHAEEKVPEPRFDNMCSLISSVDPIKKALGLSIMNAISQYLVNERTLIKERNLIKYLRITPKDYVVIVGYMEPLVKEVRKFTKNLYVLERNPAIRRDGLSDIAAWRVLPKATKVIISGAVLVNDTLDMILELSENADEKVITGPTAQLLPYLFFNIGLTGVASLRITDVDKAARAVRLGGGARVLYKLGFKYIVFRSR